jgi:hypothetical protein
LPKPYANRCGFCEPGTIDLIFSGNPVNQKQIAKLIQNVIAFNTALHNKRQTLSSVFVRKAQFIALYDIKTLKEQLKNEQSGK